jgi:hypothetical protein
MELRGSGSVISCLTAVKGLKATRRAGRRQSNDPLVAAFCQDADLPIPRPGDRDASLHRDGRRQQLPHRFASGPRGQAESGMLDLDALSESQEQRLRSEIEATWK